MDRIAIADYQTAHLARYGVETSSDLSGYTTFELAAMTAACEGEDLGDFFDACFDTTTTTTDDAASAAA